MRRTRPGQGTGPSDRERGSLHVAAIPMVLALVALACLLVLVVASGLSDRRSAVTAADAAALAAASVLDQAVEEHLAQARAAEQPGLGPQDPAGPSQGPGGAEDGTEGDGPPDGSEGDGPPDGDGEPVPAPVWALAGTSLEELVDLDAAYDAAERFALANDAEVVDVRFDLERWLVRVEVRHRAPLVEGEDEHAHAVAVARVRPGGGLCLSDGEIGLRLGATCRTTVPATGSVVEHPEVGEYTSRVSLVS